MKKMLILSLAALPVVGACPAMAHVGQTDAAATVQLAPVKVSGYANEQVFVSGLPAGTQVVTAGVHKMAPGLRVALSAAAEAQLQGVAQ